MHLSQKTAFLLILASGRRRGEISALIVKGIEYGTVEDLVVIKSDPNFVPKTAFSGGPLHMDPLSIPSLPRDEDDEEGLLCPVRAVKIYLDRVLPHRGCKEKVFISVQRNKQNEITPSTLAGWVKKLIMAVYEESSQDLLDKYKVKPHDVRALSASWALHQKVPLEDILQAATWSSHTTFTRFYLTNMTNISEGMLKLGPLVVSQKMTNK